MRIVRPGSVVGPQQQYMYLKQLEWSKWAAVDEMRRQQVTSSVTVAPALVTPATPPAETDEDLPAMDTTPPLAAHTAPLPPVTPSRHVAAATAKAKAIATPGQPRKTPNAKRIARDSDEEETDDDVLPALGLVPIRNKLKNSRAAGPKGVAASEQRPTRMTRSTAQAAAIRKGGTGSSTPASPQKSSSRQGPNKIPRLATTKTTSAAKATIAAANPAQLAPPARGRPAPSPIPPSRLPTLIPAKKPGHTSSLSEVATQATLKKGAQSSDAWMTTNVAAVVVPGTKSERPGLRSVRRRRSSFSSADVVA